MECGFGLIAGWFAGKGHDMRGGSYGLVGDIVVGVAGDCLEAGLF